MKPSALQQALSAIGDAQRKLITQGSGVGVRLIQQGFGKFGNQVQSVENMLQKSPVPKDRKTSEAIPVASAKNGSIIYSDGTVRNPNYIPNSPADKRELEVLRQNLLQQIPYTPKAAALVRGADMYTFGGGLMSSEDNQMGGFAYPGEVWINRNNLGQQPNWGPTAAANVLSHELLHYMDDQLYNMTPKDSVANTIGFAKVLKKHNPKILKDILNGPLSTAGLYDKKDTRTQDVESFAYFGQEPRMRLSASPQVQERYNRIYQPMSKNINMSPKYPAPEVFIGLTSKVKGNLLPGRTIEDEDY